MFFFNSISRKLVFLPRVTKSQLTLFHVGARSLGARPVRTVQSSPVPFFKKSSPESLKNLILVSYFYCRSGFLMFQIIAPEDLT